MTGNAATRRFVLRFVAGMLAGGAGAFALDASGVLDGVRDGAFPVADLVALLLAVTLLAIAGFALLAGSSTRRYRRMIDHCDDENEPIEAGALANARRQALVLALAAIMLAVPPLVMVQEAGIAARQWSAAGLGVLLLAESWHNWRLWRDSDELSRAVIAQSAMVSFWILQLLLFGWAALARLALIPDIGSWTMVQAMLAVYLTGSFVVGYRRGLATP